MKKEMNNKGFSLVELIIVVAIMAVLIGVLAPTYLKYVENSKKTSDCSAMGSILDAVEVIAVDPQVTWNSGTFTATFTNGTASYADTAAATDSDIAGLVEEIASAEKATLKSNWASKTFSISASKDSSGKVLFSISDATVEAEIGTASKALEARFD